MTTTLHHSPAGPSTVDALNAVTDLLTRIPALDDPDVTVAHHGSGGGIVLHITPYYGPAQNRRNHIAALGITLEGEVRWIPMLGEKPGHWGNVETTGRWAGVRIHAWTPLTRMEARALGYITCADCGHTDHDDDVACLVAVVTEDAVEGHCRCGVVTEEPVVADLTETQRLHLALVAGRSDWDDDAREACDMDAFDAESDRAEAGLL